MKESLLISVATGIVAFVIGVCVHLVYNAFTMSDAVGVAFGATIGVLFGYVISYLIIEIIDRL